LCTSPNLSTEKTPTAHEKVKSELLSLTLSSQDNGSSEAQEREEHEIRTNVRDKVRKKRIRRSKNEQAKEQRKSTQQNEKREEDVVVNGTMGERKVDHETFEILAIAKEDSVTKAWLRNRLCMVVLGI